MLINVSPPAEKDFESHAELSQKYGVKAAGLAFLPPAWRLDFAALSIFPSRAWKEGNQISSHSEIQKLKDWLDAKKFSRVILRSSGTLETMTDRGKFRSVILDVGWNFKQLIEKLEELYQSAQQVNAQAELGVVVQQYIPARFTGHLSNEHRVSPTINQWSYELEKPKWTPSRGITSKSTTSPDPTRKLHCGNRIPHQPLRSVAHFLVDEFMERCHIEWMVHESTLILAQIDFEWLQIDQGLDPKKHIHTEAPADLDLSLAKLLAPYRVGTETKWPKLKNLSDFDFGDVYPSPRIYPLSPKILKGAQDSYKARDALCKEMVGLTGNRLVVRTDCVQEGVESFNLPRTDTITVEDAIDWCHATMAEFAKRGIHERNYIFLFHAFLPARAAAWAYAKPDNPVVIVDALWGLPDGLQVLPVDTYEVNVFRHTVVGTKTTFKPKFLTELEDGTWGYRNVQSRCGRFQVLTKADKLEIATRTAKIANKLGEDAQIMWFCNIPLAYQVKRNFPWFRSREKFDPAPRQEFQYKPFVVSKPDDLKFLSDEKVTIRLSPEANLIRDEALLDAVVTAAKEKSLPVLMEGSILGHAFYRLNQEGIPVVLANAPKYYRKRNRQVFGKLVRDKIPAAIAAGGETVKEAKLVKSELRLGLAGKLLEETDELLRAQNEQEQAAEIADILEVVKGLAATSGISWAKIERLAKEKAAKRGGFKDGRVLIETALPHRDSPLERQEQVRASVLGAVECTNTLAEIPASALVASVNGPGVIFSYEDDSTRYRVSIKNGSVQIVRLDSAVPETGNEQEELFPV